MLNNERPIEELPEPVSSAEEVSVPPDRPAHSARSWPRTLGIALLALSLFAGAGFSIYRSIRSEPWLLALTRAKPESSASVPKQEGPVLPHHRCELLYFRNGSGGKPVAVLTAPGSVDTNDGNFTGIHSRLAREIMRQAVLISLREELNVEVRDRVLGDPMPPGKPDLVLQVEPDCEVGFSVLRIRRPEGKNQEPLFSRVVRPLMGGHVYWDITKLAEEVSRGELPKLLAKLGIKGTAPVQPNHPETLPDGVEDRLRKMSFPSQFVAVRQMHEALRSSGSSPARLHALARGYANLGALTEINWDASSQVYRARSFLYAQRDVSARPKAPVARWNRAYAATLAGLHRWALDDTREAVELVERLSEGEKPSRPHWLDLIDAHCHFDVNASREPKDERWEGLARFLYLLTVERPARTDLAIKAAREMIQQEPACFRAYQVMWEHRGVSTMHLATTLAPSTLEEWIPNLIQALPGVPANVSEVARVPRNETALIQELEKAALEDPEAGEPRWSALAQWIRETRFVCTYWRLRFMAEIWSVPTSDYWDEIRPLIANHRFRPLLESYLGPHDRETADDSWLEKIDTSDFGTNMLPIRERFPKTDKNVKVWSLCQASMDWLSYDIGTFLSHFGSAPNKAGYAKKLLAISPYSAFGMGCLVQSNWDEFAPVEQQCLKDVGDHPSLLGPLATRYVELDRAEEAETLAERYLERSHDLHMYQLLANLARERADLNAWKSIMDRYLAESEDHGLDHAKARVEVANVFMEKELFDQARPYADEAARSWAGWAMKTAQYCAEGQKDWKAAEGWAKACAERYPAQNGYDWVDFCERTDEGDFDAATTATLRLLELMHPDQRTSQAVPLAALLIVKGRLTEALNELQAALDAIDANPLEAGPEDDPEKFEQAKIGWRQYHQSVQVAAVGLTADRKQIESVFEAFLKSDGAHAPNYSSVLRILRESLAQDDDAALDLKKVDSIIEGMPVEFRGAPNLAVAAFLSGRKRDDAALPYWRQVSASSRQNEFWWRVIADSQQRKVPSTKKP